MRWFPFSEGWGASVELIGLVVSPTLLPLSIVAGVVTLTIGVTGNIEFPFNWLKESKEHELVFPFKVPWLCFSLQLKMRRLGPWFDH